MHFLHIPARRWPLFQHGLMACALLVVMGLGCALWLDHAGKQTLALQTEITQQQELLDAASLRASPMVSQDFSQSMPPLHRRDALARDISRFAKDLGVQINTLSTETRPATALEVAKVQFNLSLQADYRASKEWLSSLLARYETLAVQSISIRSQAGDALKHEIRISLVFYAKD